ncbi:unnamed protein product [Cercospora beticola]|nr:unnamed protein product [Cercospora beticola]
MSRLCIGVYSKRNLFAEEEEVAGYELSHHRDLNQDDHLRPTSSEPKRDVTCTYMWSRHRLLNKAVRYLSPASNFHSQHNLHVSTVRRQAQQSIRAQHCSARIVDGAEGR